MRHAKYQNPSSGGYQEMVLTSFFYCYKWQRAIPLVTRAPQAGQNKPIAQQYSLTVWPLSGGG